MKIIKHLNFQEALKEPTAIALGTFDGVHKGHQEVIQTMIKRAVKRGLKSMVFTFSNLPKFYDSEEVTESRLLCIDDKIELFGHMGLDYLVIIPFNPIIKDMTHEAFISLLQKQLQMKDLTVGYNFRFGLKAAGTAQWLETQAPVLGFELAVIQPVRCQGETISSTRIRACLRDGALEDANTLLGRYHFVSGMVHPGKQLGRTIGYPTANLKISPHMTLIKSGVYITQTQVDGKCYKSVTNVGFNPTFDQEEFNLETYIFEFHEDLYYKQIKVHFLHRMRDELKFDSVETLKQWIDRDVQEAELFFETPNKTTFTSQDGCDKLL